MPARNVDAGKEGRELRRAGRVRNVGGAAHDKRQRDSGCSLLSRHALFNMSGVEGWRLGGGGWGDNAEEEGEGGFRQVGHDVRLRYIYASFYKKTN